MKKRYIALIILFVIFVVFPFMLWLAWHLTPEKPMKVFIMDKTVLTGEGMEHRSLNWVMAHKKFVKPDGAFYDVEKDYFGFFPLQDKKYKIKDLSRKSEEELDSMSRHYDMAFFTDTYGIYYNEWYRDTNQTEHSEKVYGGLDSMDLQFIEKMVSQNKMVISEFNFFASPTPTDIRTKAETMLGVQWSGWTGRYFKSLDTLNNPDLPRWVIHLYKQQHNNTWNFKGSGIVFVHEDNTIAILEEERHLNKPLPEVTTEAAIAQKFGVVERIDYPFWFDITFPTDSKNQIISWNNIYPNTKGDSILSRHNIPSKFPAAIENYKTNLFYYFALDFSDNPIPARFIRFKGGKYFEMMLLDLQDQSNRNSFFYTYYLPMTSRILNNYYDKLCEANKDETRKLAWQR